MIKLEKKKFVLVIVLCCVVSLIAGSLIFVLGMKAAGYSLIGGKSAERMEKIVSRYGKLYDMQTKLNNQGYYKVSLNKEMNAMYKALFKSVGDEYTEYMTKQETKSWNSYLNGTFSGIGVVFSKNSDGVYQIVQVLDNSPAKKAGLKAGDQILSVNGKTYKSMETMAKKIRGKAGTGVKLKIRRSGTVKTVSVIRGEVEEQSVYSRRMKGNIGYIYISSFSQDTYKEFNTALKKFEAKNVKGVVIDLRNNGGGYMDQGLKVADRLLPEGTITYMKNRAGKKTYYNSDENCTKLKYVLLVNQYTASSSEIVTAAVKDNHGGKIVGVTTYGKGVVQSQYNYKDGSSFKMTVYQYFSPKGHVINKKGVRPDKVVKLSRSGTDNQYQEAASLLK
ncbi:MAG: S41 family peptidase [Anaerovoracaceae bacterium]|jgi:carboxyl-terminal processing protease